MAKKPQPTIVGYILFAGGATQFRLDPAELELNDERQLGNLIRCRVELARRVVEENANAPPSENNIVASDA